MGLSCKRISGLSQVLETLRDRRGQGPGRNGPFLVVSVRLEGFMYLLARSICLPEAFMWLLRPSNVLPHKNRGACPCSWASRGAEEHVPSLVLLITYLAAIGGW